MIQIGQTIPDGMFEAFHKEQICSLQLSEYRGKWLILIVYPGDFTFICPTELQELGALYPEFQKLGAEILSVNTDSVFVHKAWHDTSPAIKGDGCRLHRSAKPVLRLLENEGVALGGSFLIDPDGMLRVMEIQDNSIGRNGRELLRNLQAAIHVREGNGEVCPASWKTGDHTLKPGLDLVGKI